MKKTFLLIIATCLLLACNDGTKETNSLNKDTLQSATEESIMAGDAVNKPALVKAQPDGSLLLTAENGKAVGPNIKYMPEWRAFGWFTGVDRVEWTVDVSDAGEYEVFLEWSVSNEEAFKEFILEANGQQLIGIVDQTGSWETYLNKNIGRIKLAEGRQTMVFKPKSNFEKGALLDLRQIKLTGIK